MSREEREASAGEKRSFLTSPPSRPSREIRFDFKKTAAKT
jgi:hypothetical protein